VTDVDVEVPIGLGAFLKVAGVAATGGHAKLLIQGGRVRVNGAVEMRRGRRLDVGDTVVVGTAEYRVCSSRR